mgnify:CR=1 FL=1
MHKGQDLGKKEFGPRHGPVPNGHSKPKIADAHGEVDKDIDFEAKI